MTVLDSFRSPELIEGLKKEINSRNDKNQTYRFMEVCGTHTMSIFRYGLRSVLPENIDLISGPGCPVCVTATDYIDTAIEITKIPKTIVTTFGDMLKVPGSNQSLYDLRSEGKEIHIVYSSSDALDIARKNPGKTVVFIGIGFETTAPTTAATILTAEKEYLRNFFLLAGHKTMPQAMKALAESGELKLDGFLCPPHVSAITGTGMYNFLSESYRKACVVAGFEPTDILQSVLMLMNQINNGRAEVENQYSRVVTKEGNTKAQAIINKVFEKTDSVWRGLGPIPGSGLKLRNEYREFDILNKIDVKVPASKENAGCICGDVLTGRKKPVDCPLFRKSCTPESPKGACMVSSEGTCAAYFRYYSH